MSARRDRGVWGIAVGLSIAVAAIGFSLTDQGGGDFCAIWQEYQGEAERAAARGEYQSDFGEAARVYAQLQSVAPPELEEPLDVARRAIEEMLTQAPEGASALTGAIQLAGNPDYMPAQLEIAQYAAGNCSADASTASSLLELDPGDLEALSGLTRLLFDTPESRQDAEGALPSTEGIPGSDPDLEAELDPEPMEPAAQASVRSGGEAQPGSASPSGSLALRTRAASQIAGGEACAALETLRGCADARACQLLLDAARGLCPGP